MNYPFIRRAAVLALALFLALTVSISLAAPGYAGNAGTTGSQSASSATDATGGSIAVPVTGITLNPKTLSLGVGKTAALTAAVTPANATDKTVVWSSSDNKVATVKDGVVTAVGAGKATITAAAQADEKITASCEVAVVTPGITIVDGSTVYWTQETSGTLTVLLSGIEDNNPEITWTATFDPGLAGVVKPTFSGTGAEDIKDTDGVVTGTKVTGTEVTVNRQTAGEFTITAKYTDKSDNTTYTCEARLIISGIVLSGQGLDPETGTMEMVVNGRRVLTADSYGVAADDGSGVLWTSDNASVIYVMPSSGNLNAWNEGVAVIKAVKGAYSAECTVTVVEDTSAVADNGGKGYHASISEPLVFGEARNNNGQAVYNIYAELEDICKRKTKDMYGTEEALKYITNLKVSPGQGTLYYSYGTEADTGNGVGANEQFTSQMNAGGALLSVDRLYFVPAQGFIGTAEITFNAVSQNRNFPGVIRVEVSAGSSGGAYQINYGTRTGEAVWFQASDFDAFCRGISDRGFNYVVFNLPRSSEGVLYYNYVSNSGSPVTTSIQFTEKGQYTIDDVCFVPNAAYEGTVDIGFRIVNTLGASYDGTVKVVVSSSGGSQDPSSVTVAGELGRPVTLPASLFNDACKATLRETLSFVTFKLPDPDVGTLYYNYRSDGSYESRVTAGGRYYFSGVPGLGGVSFVPAPSAAGRVAIPYTGYSAGGASFGGTLYIDLGEAAHRSTIYYSVAKGGSVLFRASDFYNAALYQTGIGVTAVTFDLSGVELGTLYYNYRGSGYSNARVRSGTPYYYSSNYSQRLSLISFHAGDATGIVTIPYTAVCGTGKNQRTFTGSVVIRVGSLTPEDISLSCNTSGYARVSAWSVDYVCGAVMAGSLSYIEITSVPGPEEGRLYLDYSGFGTGTAVKQGDRLYYSGSPNISQLTFVPHARFTGEAEITYLGYSYSNDNQEKEQVSGRIVVSVSSSTSSQYFDDMSGYKWAADSVDYLYWNGTVKGIGGRRFEPGLTISRGDFALMLVRAYGFTASGSISFDDVPEDSYYADAIRVANRLGIVSGYNGNFYPQETLSRQDAVQMIYNALKASGKTLTNGLAADLSGYRDEGMISSYAIEAMGSLVQMGVVKGDGGYLQPQRQLTRAEAAMLLHTIMTL